MHRFVSLLLVAGVASSVPAQITDADAALRRAEGFLEAAGTVVELSEVGRWERGERDPVTWQAESDDRQVIVRIDEQTGKLTVFSDARLAVQMRHPAHRTLPWSIETDGQAWTAADRIVSAAGLSLLLYRRSELKWLVREPDSARYAVGYGTSLVARYVQPVPGYVGELNSATVTLDVVTGRLQSYSATVHWSFSPPRSTLSRDQAVAAVRRALEPSSATAGGVVSADADPSDEGIRAVLVKQVIRIDSSAYASPRMKSMAQRRLARVAWTLEHPTLSLAIDAETGDLLYLLHKHSSAATLHRKKPQPAPPPDSAEAQPSISNQAVGAGLALGLGAIVAFLRRSR